MTMQAWFCEVGVDKSFLVLTFFLFWFWQFKTAVAVAADWGDETGIFLTAFIAGIASFDFFIWFVKEL